MSGLDNFTNTINTMIDASQENVVFVGGIIGALWLVHAMNCAIGGRLNVLGIYPRSLFGLPGIVCSPFIHGSVSHLFFNSIPLFLLINFLLIDGEQHFYIVTLYITVGTGVMVWLFARKAFHIGASGVIMGYWGYLIAEAIFHPSMFTIVVASVMLYYLGSLVCNLIPAGVKTSWEAHIFGAIAGVATAFLLEI